MKYVISFLFCVSVYGAPIQIFHESSAERAEMVKQIFMGQYKIPEDLIEKKETARCEEIKRLEKLSLCLKNNGDLLVVSVDKRFVSESLKIFYAP